MHRADKVGAEKEHTDRIGGLFSAIAGKYDSINRQQSLRRDVFWRKFTADRMRFFNTMRYLDVATGTADLALDVSRRNPDVKVVGVDIADALLKIGRGKAEKQGLAGRVELMYGNALDLEFDDGSFDVAGIAFGIRNIRDRLHALSEMRRVVAPGGQVMVLELSYHGTGFLKPLYWIYIKTIIPFMARLFSNNREAYQYLGRSIVDFPAPEEFCGLMQEAGLENVRSWPLTFGVTRLFVGNKPG
jgi:demethylmenaquinone methyltransferase/2-methoxy-6-polyprenyl-1,4-benzoquinol methylase